MIIGESMSYSNSTSTGKDDAKLRAQIWQLNREDEAPGHGT
jgi:hypothetical protein